MKPERFPVIPCSSMLRKNIYLVTLLLLIILSTGCGSGDSGISASQDQYKDVALRYLRALAQRDFDTFMKLDIQSQDHLAMVKVPELPAFDRQQRMQNAINEANRYIRGQFDVLYLPGTGGFNSPKWIVDHLKGATTFNVVEVGPVKGGVAEIYIEVQGRGKNIFFVPVVYKNGQWGVDLRSVGIHGKSTRLQ
jgi:hypothetical protein